MATIELYTKVAEVTIAELRPASMNRSIAEAQRARIAEEERLKKEAYEKETHEIAVSVLTKLSSAINAKAESGEEHLEVLWMQCPDSDKDYGIRHSEWVRCESIVRELLESQGYSVHDTHNYTSSWVSRSGKVAYVNIYWHE